MTDKFIRRMELYKQGLSDSKIAEAEGTERKVIAMWRFLRKLSNNGTGWNRDSYVPMEQALNERGCSIVRQFFAELLTAADQCKGKKNVAGFMHTWHDLAKEGKRVAS